MPLYEFRCPECETDFEERRPFARADEPATCPACAGTRAEKVIVAALFFTHGKAIEALEEPASTRPSGRRHAFGCPCCSG